MVELIAWFVFAGMTVLACYDVKKAVIIWPALRLLFNAQVSLKYSAPALSLDLGVSMMIIAVFFIATSGRSRRIGLDRQPFVLDTVFAITLTSFFLSSVFSEVPLVRGLNTSVKYFVMRFGLLYVFQRSLCNSNDIKLYIRTICVIIVLITGLGIYEFFTLDNPVLNFIFFNSPHDDFLDGRMNYVPASEGGEHLMRYGLARAFSFFGLHLHFGAACVFLLFLIGVLWKNKHPLLKEKYSQTLVILLLAGVFASNSKQAYIGVIILLFCFVDKKYIFSYRLLLVLLALGAIFWFFPELANNYLSLTDEELAEEGGGSSIALRVRQYEIALRLFEYNPILGSGPTSLDYWRTIGENAGILGAESIWLSILPERGLLGAIAYISMYAFLYQRLVKVMPKKELVFYLLTIFVMENAGGNKDMTIYGTVLIAVARIYQMSGYRSFDKQFKPQATMA